MKYHFIHIILLFSLLIFSACGFEDYKLEKGTMDLSLWNPEDSDLIRLKGECEFYWGPRYDIDDFYRLPPRQKPIMVSFPSIWNGTLVNESNFAITRKGFVAYHMKIVLPENPGVLAFKMPYMYSSYRFFINGKLYARNGEMAKRLSQIVPEAKPLVFSYLPDSDTLDIVLQVGNYEYIKGGIQQNIILGPEQKVYQYKYFRISYDVFIASILFIIGCFHVYFFSIRKDKAYLIMGLAALLIFIRTTLMGEFIYNLLLPDIPWRITIRLEFIVTYIAALLSSYFVGYVFPDEKPNWFYQFINAIFILFVIILFMPISYFSKFFLTYGNIIIVLTFILQIWIMWKAFLNNRKGAGLYLIGFVVLLISVVNDSLYTSDIIKSFDTIQFALLIFLLLQALLMNRRTAHAYFMVEQQKTELDKYRNHLERMITDRTRTLRESEARFRAVSDNAPVMICSFNEKGKCIYWNDQCEKIFGYSFYDIENLGKLDSAVWNQAWINKVLHPDNEFSEFILQTKTGNQRRQLWASYLISEDQTFGVGYDITDKQEAKHKLLESQQRYKLMVDNSKQMILDIDYITGMTTWDGACEDILGIIPENKIELDHEKWNKRIHPEDAERVVKFYDKLIKHPGKYNFEYRLYNEKKGYIYVEETGVLFIDDNNKPVRLLFTVKDVTDRRISQELMLQNEKMSSVGTLAAGVAHEINNPLAGISQNVQLLNNRLVRDLPKNIDASEKAGIKFSDLQKYLELRNINEIVNQTQKAVSQAVKIVKNMLNFSRKSDSSMAEYSIISLVNDVIDLTSSDFSIDKGYDFRKIQITRKYDKNLKPVYCDRVKIQQVFMNIFKNGAEAMAEIVHEKGYEPKFEIVIKPEDEYIRIEIANNGPPISDSVRKRIFEPFFTTKEVGKGTGLGLSVSYYIITKDHKGQMFLEKGGNKETRFVILLPQHITSYNS